MKELIQPANSWKNTSTYLKDILTNPWYQNLSSLTSEIIIATHDFYKIKGIKPFIFPVTTGSVSSPMGKGSDSIPIAIKIKGNTIFLADSMQFSLELATRLNNKGAYYIMPTFRGEDNDQRHLNEFIHSEVEISGTFDNILELAEEYIKFLLSSIYKNCKDTILSIVGSLDHIEKLLLKKDHFYRISYADAVTKLKSKNEFLADIGTGYPVVTSLGEKELIRMYGDFVWLTYLPYSNVPFYQAQDENEAHAKAADLLAGIGEILGCGQRVSTKLELEGSISFHNVNFHGYEWYAEMKEIAPLQTSGFGMGLERLILWLTKTEDIRNCCVLYRDHAVVFYP